MQQGEDGERRGFSLTPPPLSPGHFGSTTPTSNPRGFAAPLPVIAGRG
jgi:hypothetical protein